MSVDQAIKILKSYNSCQIKRVDLNIETEEIRQALRLITSLSESVNFGICADNTKEGFSALANYLQALGYNCDALPDSLTPDYAPVYLKFNTKIMKYYVDSYTGTYRGVLVSCQSSNDTLVGTYGHFPLTLFVEGNRCGV